MCNLNVIVVLIVYKQGPYLLFAIRFSSKFQNSVFYQHMRPKSGLKFPRPFEKRLTFFLNKDFLYKLSWKEGKYFPAINK